VSSVVIIKIGLNTNGPGIMYQIDGIEASMGARDKPITRKVVHPTIAYFSILKIK
jgi:hypothetical protein